MSKIVQAVNAMIANPHLISDVYKAADEFFFLYKGRYKWSMASRESGRWLWYYPGPETLQVLVSRQGGNWDGVDMVSYCDTEIGTKEAKASFGELHSLLQEKVYGVDDVLTDIISSNGQ
jgi:hypothetical protein